MREGSSLVNPKARGRVGRRVAFQDLESGPSPTNCAGSSGARRIGFLNCGRDTGVQVRKTGRRKVLEEKLAA